MGVLAGEVSGGRGFWREMVLAGNVDFGGKNMDRLNMCVAFGGKMSKYRLIMEKRKSNQNCFRILCFGFRRAFPFQDVGGHSMPPY